MTKSLHVLEQPPQGRQRIGAFLQSSQFGDDEFARQSLGVVRLVPDARPRVKNQYRDIGDEHCEQHERN